MPTHTLQEIYDNMKKEPMTIPDPDHYIIKWSLYSGRTFVDNSYDDTSLIFRLLDGTVNNVNACAIGEAGVQLAKLTKECFTRTTRHNTKSWDKEPFDSYTIRVLEKCIPETAIKKILPLPRNYSSTGDLVRRAKEDNDKPVSFWRRVEEWYSFTSNKHSRTWSVAKAAREFEIPLRTK